ncbi:type IX secretion system PorP/SprF family membrane protein [Mesonia algae]|uniref:Type IX secretion system PorP/SprF family membrane protein n=1 Tax=Mesonia algae TaxID=213248 RepID=A0A2W7HXS1_9FLAO|nr:type IX secretion system membrane protein PorP/SprF [Mesonia algae]PZW38868.1 type IX secretion system PorP/SprF family membrane protein [Mesonia algae]
MRQLIGIIIAISFCVGISSSVKAQQDAQYTQYMYNTLSINPAYAGSREVLSAVLLHRSQWVGVDGAPTTQTLSAHTPITKNLMGIGLNITNDAIGPSRQTYIDASYSYGIEVGRESQLNFGIKAGAHLLDVDYSKLDIFDNTDPNFQSNVDNKFSPQFGLGALLFAENYYVGLSVPNVLETKHFDQSNNSNSNTVAKERISYYLTGGYVFDLSSDLKLKPTLLTKMTEGAPLQVDVSANFLLYEKLTLGAAYRWDAALSGLVAFQFTDAWMLGFAYDTDTTKYTNYNDGSFEVFLRFELFKKYNKMLTPRFF